MRIFKHIRSGFTLLELMVSLSIMAIISGMLLVAFVNQNVLKIVERYATEFALSAREGQVHALGNKEFKASQEHFPGYGVFVAPQENKYIFFGDINHNNQYDGSHTSCTSEITDECLRIETFTAGYQIEEVCVNGGSCTTNEVNIVFPSHTLTPKVNGQDGFVEVRFTTSRNEDVRRKVTIYSTGYIETGSY